MLQASMAVTDRRYRRNRCIPFNGGLFKSAALRRTRLYLVSLTSYILLSNGVRGRSVHFIGSPSIPEKFSAICKIGACFFEKNRYNNIHKTMLQGVGTVR